MISIRNALEYQDTNQIKASRKKVLYQSKKKREQGDSNKIRKVYFQTTKILTMDKKKERKPCSDDNVANLCETSQS